MLKTFTNTITVLLVMFGMLAVTLPASASALGTQRALKGTIAAIDTKARTIVVTPAVGTAAKIVVATGTVIRRRGKAGTFASLRVGDKVDLKYDSASKRASNIDDSPGLYEIHGTVETVGIAAGAIVIASERGGNSVRLIVNASTIIKRDGIGGTLGDLVAGDKVEAKYNSTNMLASLIKAEVEDSEFLGTIVALNFTARTVTITPAGGGADVVLKVVASTVFFDINKKVIDFANLHVADTVEAEYDSATMIASKIAIED